jgi:7-cyano-7-deazaguanine synthase
MTKKAVCLLSGGLDSAVTSYIAKKQGYDIYALSFQYGQRHKKELFCAKKIAKELDAKRHLIVSIDLDRIGGSSLLASSKDSIEHHAEKDIGKTIPSTYVPARNTIFLSYALAYAETINADAIFLGINAVDYSAYPDCRPAYLQAFQRLANHATKRGVEGKTIRIKAPLLHLTKAEIIQKGLLLHVPFSKTWSCYKGGAFACGRCDSCLLRLKGFQEAKIKDPIPYAYTPHHEHH